MNGHGFLRRLERQEVPNVEQVDAPGPAEPVERACLVELRRGCTDRRPPGAAVRRGTKGRRVGCAVRPLLPEGGGVGV